MEVTVVLPSELVHLVEIRQGQTYDVHVEELMVSRLVTLDLDAFRQALMHAYQEATVPNPKRTQPKKFGMVLKCVSPRDMAFVVVCVIPFDASKPVMSVHCVESTRSKPIGNYFAKRQ
jgi:hypothetical protein